jgi:NitT/TauT family transport system substrate-binding protein
MFRLAAASWALALAVGVALTPAQAETVKVAIPQKGAWDSSFVEFGVRQGFFKAEGLEIESTYTEGGATNEQAVISGSVDIAMATGFLGIISAYVKGAPVRVISPEVAGVPEGVWYVKAGSPIKSLKDAHGKTIAFSNPGSSSNFAVLALLKFNGIADAKPIPVGASPNALPQVMSGQLNIGYAVPPTALREIEEGKITVIAHGNDAPDLRNETMRVNAVNLAFLQQHRATVVRFMRAYRQSYEWAYGSPDAIALFAETSGMPLAIARRTVDFYDKAANQIDEIKGLERVLAEAYAAKRIPRPMQPEEFAGLFDLVLQKEK